MNKPGFSMEKVVDMLFPVLLAAVAWLLGEITSFQNRLIAIESKIPILITEDGVPTDSPLSASKRQELKDDKTMETAIQIGNKAQALGLDVFVISHKGDTLIEKFMSTIKFEKKNDFSTIVNA